MLAPYIHAHTHTHTYTDKRSTYTSVCHHLKFNNNKTRPHRKNKGDTIFSFIQNFTCFCIYFSLTNNGSLHICFFSCSLTKTSFGDRKFHIYRNMPNFNLVQAKYNNGINNSSHLVIKKKKKKKTPQNITYGTLV